MFDGSAEAAGLPVSWGPGKNILWNVNLPGAGGSTPVICGGRIFVTSTDKLNKNLHALCFDARSGALLWDKTIAGHGRKMMYAGEATPSAVADGQRVIFMFGTGDLLALDRDGRKLWSRNLEQDHGPLTFIFLYSSSPLLYRNKLYLAFLREDNTKDYRDGNMQYYPATSRPLDSFLLCLDPANGKQVWKQVRPSDYRKNQALESYASPIPCEAGGRAMILLTGGGCLTANDWRTGREIWRLNYFAGETCPQRVVPSPTVVEGGLVVGVKPRSGPLFAVKGDSMGNIPYRRIAWEFGGDTPDTPSVLAYRGRLYCLHDLHKVLTCLDPATGRKLWSGKLGGSAIYHASPTAADGKIYCANLAGEVVVLAAGNEFKILGRNKMGDYPSLASIAIADNHLFIRTAAKLYCIGNKN